MKIKSFVGRYGVLVLSMFTISLGGFVFANIYGEKIMDGQNIAAIEPAAGDQAISVMEALGQKPVEIKPGNPVVAVVDETENPTYLYGLVRKLYLFVEGGNPNLKPARREYLFIELLESVHDDEAKLLLQIKDKKIKCRGLTYKLIKETFPELLP